MTRIMTATLDYNTNFQSHFEEWVDAGASLSYNASFKPDIPPAIKWQKIAKAKLIVFTGGEDISPAIYGHDHTYSFGVNAARDRAELLILKYALQTNKKILGVCRGHQLINAYLGGVLVQDIRKELGEPHKHDHDLEVKNKQGKIPQIFTRVNSIHHQGVVKAGELLQVTTEYKGVIESCEGPNIITTQFHPEFLFNRESMAFFDFMKQWAELED